MSEKQPSIDPEALGCAALIAALAVLLFIWKWAAAGFPGLAP